MAPAAFQPDVLTFAVVVFGGAALGLVGLLSGGRRLGRLLMVGLAVLAAGVAGWRASQGEPAADWLPPAGLAALGLGFWFRNAPRWTGARTTLLTLAANPRCQALALLAAVPLLAWGWSRQFNSDANDDAELAARVAPVSNPPLTEDSSVHAVTDKGRAIPLGKPAVGPEYQANLPREEARATTAFTRRVIQTAPPDAASNCHGWTFTGGAFWVRCEDVDKILADNNYEPVAVPQAGDLIVYRDADGAAAHSGVVRCVTRDGLVLVESKWGPIGRYLHTPEDQSYGSSYTFYRTTRVSHLLRGLPGTTGAGGPPPTVLSEE